MTFDPRANYQQRKIVQQTLLISSQSNKTISKQRSTNGWEHKQAVKSKKVDNDDN